MVRYRVVEFDIEGLCAGYMETLPLVFDTFEKAEALKAEMVKAELDPHTRYIVEAFINKG